MDDPRMHHFSIMIDLWKLEHENQKYLRLGFLFAVLLCAELALTPFAEQFNLFTTAHPEKRRVIRTDLVVVPAKSHTTPFEMKFPATTAFRSLSPHTLRSGLSLPSSRTGLPERDIASLFRDKLDPLESEPVDSGVRKSDLDAGIKLPEESAEIPTIERVDPRGMSLEDEMLTIDDFGPESKEWQSGLVEYDPETGAACRTVIPLPTVFAWDKTCLSPGMEYLAREILMYTDCRVGSMSRFYLGENSWIPYPILFVHIVRPVNITDMTSDAIRLGEYIRNGGFLFLDGYYTRDFLDHILGTQCTLRRVSLFAENTQKALSGEIWYENQMVGIAQLPITQRIPLWESIGNDRRACVSLVNAILHALQRKGGMATKRYGARHEPENDESSIYAEQ